MVSSLFLYSFLLAWHKPVVLDSSSSRNFHLLMSVCEIIVGFSQHLTGNHLHSNRLIPFDMHVNEYFKLMGKWQSNAKCRSPFRKRSIDWNSVALDPRSCSIAKKESAKPINYWVPNQLSEVSFGHFLNANSSPCLRAGPGGQRFAPTSRGIPCIHHWWWGYGSVGPMFVSSSQIRVGFPNFWILIQGVRQEFFLFQYCLLDFSR